MNSSNQVVENSPWPYNEGEKEHERKRARIVDQLKEFPHSFQMTDLDRKSKNSLERVKQGLEAALQVGYKTPLETARARNLLSYCLFFLNKPEEAMVLYSEQRNSEIQNQNLVSLANKAFILCQVGFHEQAAEQVCLLQNLKRDPDFHYLLIKAKGELAFSYTRMGPPFYPQAIRIFKEILPEARNEEGILWTFGLALSYRRLMHIQNIEVISALGSQEPWQVNQMILSLLNDIIAKSTSRNLKAKAYSELALLLNQNRRDSDLHEKAGVSMEEACNKALELDGCDNSVLVKTGRLFRYMKNLDKSSHLLEKALSFRPSSTVYHHLGLTYKALATSIIYRNCSASSYHRGHGSRGSRSRGRGGRGSKWTESDRLQGVKSEGNCSYWWRYTSPGHERQNSGEPHARRGHSCGTGRSQETDNRSWRNIREDQPFRNRPASRDEPLGREHAGVSNPCLLGLKQQSTKSTDDTEIKQEHNITAQFEAMSLKTDESSHRHSQENSARDTLTQRDLGRLVKTPNGNETKFSINDAYIPQAIQCFSQAVEFSKGENTRAVYDLALIKKALGEYGEALMLLEKIRNIRPSPAGAFDKVNAWEQTGLILKDLSKNETDERKKEQLDKDGEGMLRAALCEAMRLFSRAPDIQPHVCQVWHSFPTLLAEIEKSDSNIQDKFKRKAYLFHLVKKPDESISILQELQRLSPEEKENPETLKLLIKSYTDMGQYQTAAIFINLLKCTSQGTPTMNLFEDRYYTQNVYIKAGKQHLLESSELARPLFLAAFTDIVSDPFYGSSSSACSSSDSCETSSSSDSEDLETWHVMLLYDEDMEEHANSLAELLTDACGLRVTSMGDDVMPGSIIREGILSNMKKSQLLVFMVGSKISKKLKYFITHAVERKSTVTLLIDTDKVPRQLFTHSYLAFPPDILGFKPGTYTERTANTICSLFQFLLGIEISL